ncbi:MAG: hypothetical protein IJ661_05970 [Lachnospiraceae bacterium]|nr:hypothetical protein [Lachnospiraceae bacterium]
MSLIIIRDQGDFVDVRRSHSNSSLREDIDSTVSETSIIFSSEKEVRSTFCELIEREQREDGFCFLNNDIIRDYLKKFGYVYGGDYLVRNESGDGAGELLFVTAISYKLQLSCIALAVDNIICIHEINMIDQTYLKYLFEIDNRDICWLIKYGELGAARGVIEECINSGLALMMPKGFFGDERIIDNDWLEENISRDKEHSDHVYDNILMPSDSVPSVFEPKNSLDCGEVFTPLIVSRMIDSFFDKYILNKSNEREWSDKELLTVTASNINKVFPIESISGEERRDAGIIKEYSVTSYESEFPVLYEREAHYVIFFVDDNDVVFSLDNTYKYQGWDELIAEMAGSSETICHRRGIHKAFVLYTDMSDYSPIDEIFEGTVGGFVVDTKNKTLTAFGRYAAVIIFYELFSLASKQYDCFYGVESRSSSFHINDDSNMENNQDSYVKLFNERLERYKTDFKIEEHISSLMN